MRRLHPRLPRGARVRTAACSLLCAVALLTAACGSGSSTTAASSTSSGGSSAAASGSSSASKASSGKAITAKFATFAPNDSPLTLAANKFRQYVQTDTNGGIKIVVYPNGELGHPKTVIQQIEGNTVQFTATSALDGIVPAVDLLLMPYLFSSESTALSALNSTAVRKVIWNQFDPHGIHILGVWGQGFSDLVTTKPVTSVGDMAGLKIRTYAPVIQGPEYKLLHANAVSIPVGQVYTGLSTNLVQGATDPPILLLTKKWYEQAHYLAITQATYVTGPVEVSEKFWTGLSAAQRQALNKAWQQSLTWEENYIKGVNSKALKQMEAKGTHVAHPDLAAFKKALAPLAGELNAKFPGVLKSLQQAVQTGG